MDRIRCLFQLQWKEMWKLNLWTSVAYASELSGRNGAISGVNYCLYDRNLGL